MAKKPTKTTEPTGALASATPAELGPIALTRIGRYVASGQALLEERMRTMPSNQLTLAQQHFDDGQDLLAAINAILKAQAQAQEKV